MKSYIDSIAVAKDSSSIYSLLSRYETRLAKINMDAPPQTDLKITEGNNDTLMQLANSLRTLSHIRLNSLSHRDSLYSVPADTLPEHSPVK